MTENVDQELVNLLKQLSTEEVEAAISSLPAEQQALIRDEILLAQAKLDRFARIEYYLKDEDGNPIKLLTAQKLMIDFCYAVWGEGYTPLVFGHVGWGKSLASVALLADEVGQNQNIRTQIVCIADKEAVKRGRLAKTIINSRHYQKVYPHIKPSMPWSDHEIMVERTKNADVADESLLGESMTIDPTISIYGVGGQALGTRTRYTIFDDLSNLDNSITFPDEGEKIYQTVNAKFLNRKVAPMNKTDADFDESDMPTKFLFLANTWHQNDCTYRRIYEPRRCAMIVGVNSDLTGYNVRFYGCLSQEKMEWLRDKYSIGDIEPDLEPDKPPKMAFTIPMGRPAKWYAAEKQETEASGMWLPNYRSIVFTDAALAYPNVENSFVNGVDLFQGLDWTVEFEEMRVMRNNRDVHLGYKAWVRRPPNCPYVIANMDFSGMNRAGTVVIVTGLLPNFKRVPLAIYVAAAAGNEQSDLVTKVFKEYPKIEILYPEDAGLQVQQVREWQKHPEKYPWVYKVQPFENHGGKRKHDQQLGILAMATTFANAGFMIADSTRQDHHPKRGERGLKNGCECGFCKLVRELKTQPRLAEVKSDLINTIWMANSCMPALMDLPDMPAPEGVEYSNSGLELTQTPPKNAWGTYLKTGQDGSTASNKKPLVEELKEEADTYTYIDDQGIERTARRGGANWVVTKEGKRYSDF